MLGLIFVFISSFVLVSACVELRTYKMVAVSADLCLVKSVSTIRSLGHFSGSVLRRPYCLYQHLSCINACFKINLQSTAVLVLVNFFFFFFFLAGGRGILSRFRSEQDF